MGLNYDDLFFYKKVLRDFIFNLPNSQIIQLQYITDNRTNFLQNNVKAIYRQSHNCVNYSKL